MAGVVRFELTHVGVRVRCLTAWRYPNIKLYIYHPHTDILTHFVRRISAAWRYPNIKLHICRSHTDILTNLYYRIPVAWQSKITNELKWFVCYYILIILFYQYLK